MHRYERIVRSLKPLKNGRASRVSDPGRGTQPGVAATRPKHELLRLACRFHGWVLEQHHRAGYPYDQDKDQGRMGFRALMTPRPSRPYPVGLRKNRVWDARTPATYSPEPMTTAASTLI